MEQDMTFEEFSAVRQRKRQQRSNMDKEVRELDQATEAVKGKKAAPTGSMTILERLGKLVQSQELQLVMVVLIVVDFLSAFYQMYAKAKGWESPFLSILEYQAGLSLILFSLEISLVLLAFRGEMFTHFGYTLDFLIIVAMFYGVIASNGEMVPSTRLLNVLRLWRVARIVTVIIQATEEAHVETKAQLEMVEDKVEALKLRLKKSEQAHKREVDKYRRLEQNFRAQKEELDTMREALQIAAQTMAKVQGFEAVADLIGEDRETLERELETLAEEEQEEDDEEEQPVTQSKTKTKMKTAREAAAIDYAADAQPHIEA